MPKPLTNRMTWRSFQRGFWPPAKYCCKAAALVFLLTAPAFAQNSTGITFCKLDHDQTWYFSLGRIVFERARTESWKHDLVWTILTNVSSQDTLTPPDPSSPVGCRDNPQQLSGLSTDGWPVFENDDGVEKDFPGQIANAPMLLNMYYNPVPATIRKTTETYVANIWDWLPSNHPFHKRFSDGTIYYTGKIQGMTDPDHFNTWWVLIVSPKAYPLALPWEKLEMQEISGDERSTYFLNENILIDYRTEFVSEPVWQLEKKVVDFDRAVQTSLRAAEIPNYPWPRVDAH